MPGINTTAELKAMVENYQKGRSINTSEESLEPIQFNDEPTSEQVVQNDVQPERITYMGPVGALMRGKPTDPYATTFGEEMVEKGYGKSRFDERVGFTSGEDIEDLRAQEQSWIGKVTNGLVKGGATTLTTAANSTIGLVAGLGSSMFELGKELFTDDRFSLGDIANAGVNNTVSNFLIKLQEGMEEIAPNYKTAEERTDEYQRQWYKHMLSGNFVGDSFLKNLGFTAGSILGGMAWNKVIGAAFASKLSSDLMKGAVSASVAGDAEAMANMKNAAEAIAKAGNLNNIDVDVIVKNFKDAGKTIKRASFTTQLLGATTAAMGEGTVEGIMAKNEYLDEFNQKMDTQYQQAYASLEDRLRKQHPEWFVDAWDVDENGQTVRRSILVSDEGKEELLRQQLELSEQYNKTKEFAETQGEVLARSTFLLNLPILMSSNLVQFGRTFGGGWTTARRNIQGLNGKLGSLTPKGSKALNTAIGSVKVGLSEASEEMLQGFASSGTKSVADTRVSAYIDNGYDKEAALKAIDGIYPFMQAGKDYLGDVKNWQEGAIGAITGLLGMPSTHFRGNKTVGDYFKGWNGGVIGEYQKAKSEYEAAQTAANNLNTLVNNPDFKQRWTNYIRHMKYDDDMLKAAQEGNKYAWHTADGNQLISDVIDFAETGRLNDLYEFVDDIAKISPSDQTTIDEIKKIIDPKTAADKNLLDSMPNDYVLEKVQSQAKHMKDVINSYREVYENLVTLMPQSTESQRFKELMFTSMQVKDFESRFHELLTKTLTSMDGLFQASASRKENAPEEEETDLGKAIKNLQSLRLAYGDALSGGIGLSILDIAHAKAADGILDQAKAALENSIKKFNLVGDARAKVNDTISQLQDMRQLASDRREFIKKIMTLREMTDSKFDSTALNSEKAQQQTAAEDATTQTQDTTGTSEQSQPTQTQSAPQDDGIKKMAVMTNYSKALNAAATDNDSTIVRAAATQIINQMRNNPNVTSDDMLALASDKIPSIDDVFGALMGMPTFKSFNGDRQAVYNQALGLATRAISRVAENLRKIWGNNPAPARQAEPQPTRRQAPVDPQADKEKKQQLDSEKAQAASAAAANAPEIAGTDEPNGSDETEPIYKVGDRVTVNTWERGDVSGVVTKVEFNKSEGDYYIHVEDAMGEEIAWVPQDSDAVVPYTEPVSEPEPEESQEFDYSEKPTVEEPAAGSYVASQRDEELSFEEESALVEATESAERDYDDLDSMETDSSGKQTYYNTAIPELGLDTLRNIRKYINDKMYGGILSVTFKKFVEANPDYAKLWDYLLDHDAFNNMDKLVATRDNKVPIYFIVDPNAVSKGVPDSTIFMAYKNSAGEYKIFNVLRENFGRNAKREWAGLNALRKDIFKEYEKYKNSPSFDGNAFVFSKTSNAWARRAGYIEYAQGIENDTPINHKDGYDSSASIVIVNQEGELATLYGEEPNLRKRFRDIVFDEIDAGNRTLMEGNVYYIARGADNYGIPIRLNVEHFNSRTVNNKGYGYDQITEQLQNIVDLSHRFAAGSISAEDANVKKNDIMNELGKYLDIHGIVISFGYTADEPTTRFYYYEDSFTDEGKYEKGDLVVTPDFISSDITVDALKEEFAKLDRSFFVNINPSPEVSAHVHKMAEAGLFTSNATKMRAQGTDIYIDAYDPKTGKFGSTSRSAQVYDVTDIAAPSESSDNLDFFGNDTSGDGNTNSEMTAIPENSEYQYEQDTDNDELSYDYLAKNNQAAYNQIKANGYSKETWNALNRGLKQQFMECF